jgi:N-acetylmuramic acid 6-phosphate etherase
MKFGIMKQKINLSKISTESINIDTINIDKVSTIKLVQLINDQDRKVAFAVKTQLSSIARAIDAITKCLLDQGRLIYLGAGTSGRIGILDASEMLPTFGVKNNTVVALIAGGARAMYTPAEGAEDDETAAINDLKKINFNKHDVLVGLSASGRTPYVISGIRYANKIGARTISVSTANKSMIGKIAKIKIEAVTGPETITGSTRMKSGTAQKMVLNMLSTGAMIKIGKTYGNLMIDLNCNNEKLKARAHNIIKNITKASDADISKTLRITNNQVKPAIVMLKKNVDYHTALLLLKKNGVLKKVID